MPNKTYSDEFKRDAVALYETTPGASFNTIARDIGVNRLTLRAWCQALGTGMRLDANSTQVAYIISAPTPAKTRAEQITDAERIRRLEAENSKLREERDILRKSAKYFAEETNW